MAAKLTEPKLTLEQAKQLVKETEEEQQKRWEADPRPVAPIPRIMEGEPIPPIPEGFKEPRPIRAVVIVIADPRDNPILARAKALPPPQPTEMQGWNRSHESAVPQSKANGHWRRVDAPPGSYNGITDTVPD
jgi:hypothetical protein